MVVKVRMYMVRVVLLAVQVVFSVLPANQPVDLIANVQVDAAFVEIMMSVKYLVLI